MAEVEVISSAAGVLTLKLGSTRVRLDIPAGTVTLSEGELGDQVYDFKVKETTAALDNFAHWWTQDEDEIMVSDVKVPNEFEVIVNVGNGIRSNVLDDIRDTQIEDSETELWAYMAHNLLRFATNKMGQMVNGGQVSQSPALPQPGVLPFRGSQQ
jgi:hypothetical protein